MVSRAQGAGHISFAPTVAVMFGVAAAIVMAAVPVWRFESLVVASGLPTLLHFAGPPLGLTARLVAIALAFLGVSALVWLAMIPVGRMLEQGRRRRTPWKPESYGVAADAEMPSVEARRRPIFAPKELGAPLMSDEAIAAAQPFAAAEPGDEIPLVLDTVVAPAPEPIMPDPDPELAAPLRAAEFGLPPLEKPEDDDGSIHSLIRRLESGLARLGNNRPDPDGPSTAPVPLARSWMVHEGDASSNPQRSGVGSDSDELRQALGTLRKLAAQ